MKILYFFLIFSFGIYCNCLAQALIAVHNETSTAFYASLDTAITKAQSGDYLYLPGGNFTITKPITKKLMIVGVGHNPDSCAATRITQVTGIFNINSGSNGGSISGIKINDGITFTAGQTVANYLIERCNLPGLTLALLSSNILVNECVIHASITGSGSQGFQLTRCIIDGGYISGISANAFFVNNIFLSTLTIGSASYPVKGGFFKNNIFLLGVTESSSTDNLFQNNLFNTLGSVITSIKHNNIAGPVTDLFKNKTKAIFDYDQDYHILTTSPAHNASTDGTDLGIYGTGSPWKDGSMPGNPHIQKNIISTISGLPNINTKVAAQDY